MIPSYLGPSCFWDCDPQTVDPKVQSRFVIERIMEFGDDNAISWLLRMYTHGDIAAVLRYSRVLSPKTISCWTNYLGFDTEDNPCIPRSCPQEDSAAYQP